MKPPKYISAYLDYSFTHTPIGVRERRLRNRAFVLWHYRPRLTMRTWSALSIWALLFGSGLYLFSTHHTLPRQATVLAATTASAETTSNPVVAKPATAALPGGPSGQLLPPGTMAPAYTYKNSYSRGQCTWYVAGRRPVPGNWGNARTWFSHARAAGWATGTTPAVGAIAWTPNGYYGHVALVEGVDTATGRVLVSEMNYIGPYRIDQRWAAINDFKYIY